jgi:aspartyl-tRNA(Asn)/glutamyl-tRNA(Gln) amidotransferase subunit B
MNNATNVNDYELVVGMECHAELLTHSKMFCGCSAEFGGAPNTRVCPVCLGLPGSLPVPNRRAVEFVVRTALALNCEISSPTVFHRKNYFYPDLPKAYQISQYDDPIGKNGWIDITVNGETRRIRVRRVHLEEDTGKLFHVSGDVTSLVDYNRSGVPLMEIVSEPDIHSPEEADEYLKALRDIIVFLGVSDGKMEEGSFRAEPNISVHPKGSAEYGTRTELKNLNSFRVVTKGIEAEYRRQVALLRSGKEVVQCTLRWDEGSGKTVPMRYKETEADYRYFPDPDLVPLEFAPDDIARLRASLPELPRAMRERFVSEYGLSAYDATVLTADKAMAGYFEAAAKASGDPKAAANWVANELLGRLNADGRPVGDSPVAPEHLGELVRLIADGTISGKMAKTVFDEMYQTGKAPRLIVEERGLVQLSDARVIEEAVDAVLAANPSEVERYRNGEEKLMAFFVGQVMKATRGKANPGVVNVVLKQRLV